jgi:hypothetical protein
MCQIRSRSTTSTDCVGVAQGRGRHRGLVFAPAQRVVVWITAAHQAKVMRPAGRPASPQRRKLGVTPLGDHWAGLRVRWWWYRLAGHLRSTVSLVVLRQARPNVHATPQQSHRKPPVRSTLSRSPIPCGNGPERGGGRARVSRNRDSRDATIREVPILANVCAIVGTTSDF